MKLNVSLPEEKIFFFSGSANRNLLGFIHYADTASNAIGIVYCHPFAEEKNMSHSVVVKAARTFAASGFPVFRFDLSGCGDSEGDFQNSSIEDWQQDIAAAIAVFREETGVSQCLLWGLRMGAGLALLQQQRNKDIAGLILWQPVLDFSVHMKQFLRRTISTQISKERKDDGVPNAIGDLHRDGLVFVIGYPITKDLCESFNRVGNQPANAVLNVPNFVLSISMMEQPSLALKKYIDFLKRSGTGVTSQHVAVEPFWDRYWQWECEKATEATLQWLSNWI